MTFPFPNFYPASRGPASLIDRTVGTIISNATLRPGAAFDGVTFQSNSQSTNRTSSTMYVGKSFPSPVAVESVTTFGTANSGYRYSANQGVTIYLYGKVGAAPANETDGTLLGSLAFTSVSDESAGRQIVSSNINTYWDHVWVYINAPSASHTYLAELQIMGWQ